jgi:metal-dependent amidase/aminoacylase/carboxypeptidase family protein
MTTATDSPRTHPVLDGLDAIIQPLENLYRDLHAHPELSDHEKRTAAKAAEQLERAGCQVSTGVGGTGAQAMIDDHLFGRGGHGAWPEATIDPIVMAAGAVLRLQTIVSREIAAFEPAVPDHRLSPGRHQGKRHPRPGRPQDQRTQLRRRRPRSGTGRDQADRHRGGNRLWSARTPQFQILRPLRPDDQRPGDGYPRRRRVPRLLRSRPRDPAHRPAPVSEDFGLFGREWKVPSLFWYVGGTDPGVYNRAAQAGRIAQDVPTNHSSKFAPVLHPTLETGIQTLATATLSYLGH